MNAFDSSRSEFVNLAMSVASFSEPPICAASGSMTSNLSAVSSESDSRIAP